jgi:hypothetical protein
LSAWRIETDVIGAWQPSLNIAKNPHPLAKLKQDHGGRRKSLG